MKTVTVNHLLKLCQMEIAKECYLNSDDEEELLANAQVRRVNDGFFIESVPINGFHPDF